MLFLIKSTMEAINIRILVLDTIQIWLDFACEHGSHGNQHCVLQKAVVPILRILSSSQLQMQKKFSEEAPIVRVQIPPWKKIVAISFFIVSFLKIF